MFTNGGDDMSVCKTKRTASTAMLTALSVTNLFGKGHLYYIKKRNGLKGAIKL